MIEVKRTMAIAPSITERIRENFMYNQMVRRDKIDDFILYSFILGPFVPFE
jgi:hypothetical protein